MDKVKGYIEALYEIKDDDTNKRLDKEYSFVTIEGFLEMLKQW